MFSFVKKIFGSANDREIKILAEKVDYINSLEPEFRVLSDQSLIAKTAHFKTLLENGEDLEKILPQAFATVREAAARTLGQRHFDVQIMGGLVLHEGKIAEMKTGEGKTLSSTLAVYTNALSGRGVHVVTVNDYLAKRDAAWMGQIYNFLGLTVGNIVANIPDAQRREAYIADITYGTNNEYGFDYLRDNMKFRLSDYVQREFHYAIIDEVDSILIDEARTPLIISGAAEKSTDLYVKINRIIPSLKKEDDYVLDEKARTATLTDIGIETAEKLLNVENLYDPSNIELLHHLDQALKAHTLFKRDTDYIIKDGKVMIVDEFTGRLMDGRRYSDGLHQALEAKESVKIENENQTYASITFQNYFRMYGKLAGMTGTADTEATEFANIYNLEVVVMPTHRSLIREDNPDVIYKTSKEKYEAVVEEIIRLHAKGQPALVGTISIAHSEHISKILKTKRIPHNVLNAKHHEEEAKIVAESGQKGSVTIATNMAGRGTDIVLGEGVAELGGLFILGTERHESRRIDNQLRGRSGRQGDPGASRFYLSLEDDLLRIFGGDRFQGLLGRLGMGDGVPLESATISRGVESAQRQVEGHHYEIRKHLLEYDDVMNKQREVIYSQRRQILAGETLTEDLLDMIYEQAQLIANRFTEADDNIVELDWENLATETFRFFGFRADPIDCRGLGKEALVEYLYEKAQEKFDKKRKTFPNDGIDVFRYVLLNSLDAQWKDHLYSMDRLKSGIGLRGYAQKNPLREYQREGFDMFHEMVDRVRSESISIISRIELREETDFDELAPKKEPKLIMSRSGDGAAPEEVTQEPIRRDGEKIGRNDSCPCGSGKKYKNCCGR